MFDCHMKKIKIKSVDSLKNNKLEAVRLAMEQITKAYGDGAIMKMGDQRVNMKVDVVPTGCLPLDIALGVGGLPRSRVTEIFGPEASGKTTLCLHVIKEAQKLGGTAAFIDAEHALDPSRTAAIGVDLDNLLISQPDNGEQALEIVETLVRSNAVDVIVVDSVAALVPKAEIEGEMGDSMMGLQARLMSQALRKLTGAISKSKAVVIFTNQMRQKDRHNVWQSRNHHRRTSSQILFIDPYRCPQNCQHQNCRWRPNWFPTSGPDCQK